MFGERIIDRAIAEFSMQHPEAGVLVIEGYFEDLLPPLQDARLDMVFCNLPGSVVPEGLHAEPVLDVRAVMMANVDHPLAKEALVTRDALADARWVIVNQPHMKDYLEHFFAVQGLQLQKPIIQTNSLALIRSLLSRDTFVSMFPEFLAEEELKSGRFKRLNTPGGEVLRQAGIIRRVQSASSAIDEASLKNFILILRQICLEEGPL